MRVSFSFFLFPGGRGAPTDTRTFRNTGNWGRAKGSGEHGGEIIIIIIIINNNNKITSPGEREPWEDLRPNEKLQYEAGARQARGDRSPAGSGSAGRIGRVGLGVVRALGPPRAPPDGLMVGRRCRL